jgi:hypothetical protein
MRRRSHRRQIDEQEEGQDIAEYAVMLAVILVLVVVVALDSRARLYSERDCSHPVHATYERAGFAYPYASSSDIYVGIEGFRRIVRPQPGDLVVWRGHVGIAIRPSRHIFFSLMRAGPGIDDYEAPYWTSRGHARFYRYVKNDPCAGCVPIRARPTGLK